MQNINLSVQATAALQKKCLLTGLVGAFLSFIGFWISREAFAVSYLTNYVFWISIPIGSLALPMIHYLTGGGWGFPIRRLQEVLASSIPIFALFLLPLLFCLPELYEWARPEAVAHDPLLAHKKAYLNPMGFIFRAILYFAIWTILARTMNRWSLEGDPQNAAHPSSKLQGLGGGGLILYGLTVTFASIDWMMSIEPHWFSTIYGLLFLIGFALSGLAFALLMGLWLRKHSDFNRVLNTTRSHDLGNILFAFILLWAYVNLSQFIIMWTANLQEEVPWYLRRLSGGWGAISVATALLHFAFPFFLLLMRGTKRNFKALATVAGLLLFMRWVDLYWFIQPVFYPKLHFHWMDLTTFAAVGGLWGYAFLRKLPEQTLYFKSDPLFQSKGTDS